MVVLRDKANAILQRVLMAHATETREYSLGDCVFRQGGECCGMFLVKSGTVRLFVENNLCMPIREQIANEGCVLGLPATMSGEPYSLTAVAVDQSTLLHFNSPSVDRMMREDSEVAMQLLSLLSAELRSLRGTIAKGKSLVV